LRIIRFSRLNALSAKKVVADANDEAQAFGLDFKFAETLGHIGLRIIRETRTLASPSRVTHALVVDDYSPSPSANIPALAALAIFSTLAFDNRRIERDIVPFPLHK